MIAQRKPVMRLLSDADWAPEVADAIARDLASSLMGRAATLALSGGSTPEPIYKALSQHRLPWQELRLVQVDERDVPRDDPQRNWRMIERAFADVWSDLGELRPMFAGPADVDDSDFYDCQIAAWLPIDVMVLGMGDDGHTASLFPGEGLTASALNVVSCPARADRVARLSVGPDVIRRARHVHLIARGASKAQALLCLLQPMGELELTPARLILQSEGQVTLWFDTALRDAAAAAGAAL